MSRATGQQRLVGHPERDAGVPDLGAGAGEPALHRLLADEEGARDLGGVQPADGAQREGHPGLRCQRRVAAQEHQLEPLVGERRSGAGHGRLQQPQLLREPLLADGGRRSPGCAPWRRARPAAPPACRRRASAGRRSRTPPGPRPRRRAGHRRTRRVSRRRAPTPSGRSAAMSVTRRAAGSRPIRRAGRPGCARPVRAPSPDRGPRRGRTRRRPPWCRRTGRR